ncbi:C39 family peptidase [Lachnospiraceae bacterium 45-W7]
MEYYTGADYKGISGRKRKTSLRKKRAVRRRRRRIYAGMLLLLAAGIFLGAKTLIPGIMQTGEGRVLQLLNSAVQEEYPQELLEMLQRNEETYEFVANYPNREQFLGQVIDVSDVCKEEKIPLLLQWDLRWGYDNYSGSMIGTAGCGPTCMAMAYLGLTGDTQMNPRNMAEYAQENKYSTEAGTSWSFFTEGAAGLGLCGRELPLSENVMKQALDLGNVIICSMRPGDFTTTGHFILLRGYDERGFFVNDPNSRKNSEKQWDFETLSGQIKCLWEISSD